MVVGGRGLAEGPEDGSGWQGSSWLEALKMVWVSGVQLAEGPKRGRWPLRRQSCWVASNPKMGLRFINGP